MTSTGDGYARAEALRTLGRDVVEAVVLDLAEADALIFAWRLGVGHRRSALEDGWFIVSLLETHALSQRRVAQRLQRSVSWASRRLSLTKMLPPAVRKAVQVSDVPAQAAMKYLEPLARAKLGHAETLVAALGGAPVSVRQVEALYRAYKSGSHDPKRAPPWRPTAAVGAHSARDAALRTSTSLGQTCSSPHERRCTPTSQAFGSCCLRAAP
jgi:hypothetical protein